MKHFLISAYVVFALLFVGCTGSNTNEPSVSNKETTLGVEQITITDAPTTPEDAEIGNKPYYDVYERNDAGSEFNTAINNNTIDSMYRQEINRATTIAEMIQTELKYIDIWQNELDGTVKKYKPLLSAEDAASFDLVQSYFEEYSKHSFTFDGNIILQKEYNVHLGTTSKWLLYVEKRESLRERTIHVKYLHYLLERATVADQQDFLSIQFDYKG